jgi:HEAT repeat protein
MMATWRVRGLATVLLALSLCVTASTQTRSQAVPPLPAEERIAGAPPPLSVTLRLSASRVAIGEVPTFTVVIRNSGRAALLLNAAAVSNIQIFTQSGELVPPATGGIVDYFGRLLKRADFIQLGAGQTREFTVQPAYHAPDDYSRFGTYLDGAFGAGGSERRLKLPAGDYSVRLTYLAFPDYAASRYNASEMTDVWEGLIEASAVPLTVLPPLPPSESDIQDAIAKIDNDTQTQASIDLLRLGHVTSAVGPMLRAFARAHDMRVAEALISLDAVRAAPEIVAAIAAFPQPGRDEMVVTRVFVNVARAASDCAAVPLIVDAIGRPARDGTDIVTIFGESLRGFADKCPDLRQRLITLIRTPVPVPATYQGSAAAYARRRAAEALGRIGNPDDVPLLVAVLRREIPGLPPATNWYSDPAREGAARALGRIGGAQAAAALLEQLNDRPGNRFIMLVIVEELGRLNPPGTAEALARLLDSSDQSVVVRVLITLQQLRATSTIPQLVAALSHSDSIVRQYASRVLLGLGAAVAPSDMRRALSDSDGNVRANALFHLVQHGDATALPEFVRGITSDAQSVREASVQGIAKFGTQETFAPLRTALETASERGAYIGLALSQLTFAPIRDSKSLPDWDEWWKTHAQRTRLQWAEEALEGPSDNRVAGGAMLAARYLASVQPPPQALIERSLSHRSWVVRDSAVAAVQAYDRPRAVALLLRELDSRYLAACRNAVKRLNALTGEKETFDCLRRTDRQRARAQWASLAGREAR